jgi:Fe-S cluster assembly scaffold protein SufB
VAAASCHDALILDEDSRSDMYPYIAIDENESTSARAAQSRLE